MGASISEKTVEQRTREIGRRFFDAIEAAAPSPWRSEWWEERAMQEMMSDEWLKVQAFRFVDTLPALNSQRSVASHLKEYFIHPSLNGHAHHAHADARAEQAAALAELSGGRGTMVKFLSKAMNFRSTGSLGARLWSWAARKGAVQMAHRFIAGQTPAQAEVRIQRMRDQQLAFSVDVLGEAAVSEIEAENYQDIYLHLITELSRHSLSWRHEPLVDGTADQRIPRVNVSVKLTSLYSQFDAIDPARTKDAVKARLRPLLRAGMENGAHIHIDMEHYAIKDLTLELCEEVFTEPEFRDYPHFGIVLQAYLKEGDADLDRTVRWVRKRGAPVWLRLVKGAYWDTETVLAQQWHWPIPVWEQKWQSDACFERMSRVMIENHELLHGAFAGHNIRSLSHAMALRELHEVPDAHFELQMLYGMADPLKRAGVAMGQRVRVYTPYGELLPGMAYLIRRLLENTSNESFLRLTVSKDTPRDALLEDPEVTGKRTPPPVRRELIRYEFGEPIMDPFVNVPNSDFSKPENRKAMSDAIAELRRTMGGDVPLVIGGEKITTEKKFDSLNPSKPGEVIGRISQADEALVDKCVDVARRAFLSWRRVSPHERADYLFKVARLMQQRRFELSAVACLECGKPWREADADISESIDFCNYYAKEMLRMADNVRRRDVPGETNEYYYAPRGVVTIISPWNFPLAILTGMTVAAVVTGNAVIFKPSQQATVIGSKLMEMFEQAGLPAGVLNYLPGPGSKIGARLVEHPHVAMLAFTGSREVGCNINETAAATSTEQPALKKVIAEMGGKNATIVDADADLDEAVHGCIYAGFGYAGQKCSAGSRVIVLADVYDRFVERYVEAARSIVVGPADEPGTYCPPVIDAAAAKTIREYIEIGKGECTCALNVDVSELIEKTGGGFYVGPTVFTDVAPDARIAQEEIFGPVVAVIKAADMDEAIEIFNGTDFALTGGIYSRSPAHIERARVECECGNFYINRKISGALVDLQPFGGFKMSGVGSKAGGPDYLIQFCEPRTVTENTLRRGFAPSEEVAEVLG